MNSQIYKARKWWSLLSEEDRMEIFENNYGVDYGSNNCNQWWDIFISDKERIQIYEDFNLIPKEENHE